MTSRDRFEQAYAEDNNCDVEWCEGQRLKESYLDRYMARAWHWWQRGRDGDEVAGRSTGSKSVVSTEIQQSALTPMKRHWGATSAES